MVSTTNYDMIDLTVIHLANISPIPSFLIPFSRFNKFGRLPHRCIGKNRTIHQHVSNHFHLQIGSRSFTSFPTFNSGRSPPHPESR